jgi:hypothetical protein
MLAIMKFRILFVFRLLSKNVVIKIRKSVILPNVCNFETCDLTMRKEHVALGVLVVIVLAIGRKVRGFKPGRGRFLKFVGRLP